MVETDKKNEVDEHHHKTFILTTDLQAKVKQFRNLGFKIPGASDPIYEQTIFALKGKLDEILPEAKIELIDMEDLASSILSIAYERRKLLRDAMVISTCPEIVLTGGGYALQINRLIDENGQILGLGPRPGYLPLADQIMGIKSILADQSVILVEDGSFSGQTMAYVIEKFQDAQIKIAAIVIGFVFPKAMEVLRSVYDGDIIVKNGLTNLLDWMPDHDFYPFIPNSGRVFGVSVKGVNYPFYCFDGTAYSVPYILPFCKEMDVWASIPKAKHNELSLFCLQQMLTLFQRIEALNPDKKILLGDLMQSRMRVCVPISVGQNTFPHLDTKVTDFLSECCIELS